MWEKVVLNLLSNAFKFTLDGGICVVLRATADGKCAELTVSDTGAGIAADQLPKLFDRFYQVGGQKGRSFEGSGIGLALVKEIANLHGGKVDVESEPGRGSSFKVRIPFGIAHLPPDQVVMDASSIGLGFQEGQRLRRRGPAMDRRPPPPLPSKPATRRSRAS